METNRKKRKRNDANKITEGIDEKMAEQKIQIPRKNGGILHGILYSCEKQDVLPPIVIMCHGFTGDKSEWGRFPTSAKSLNNAGFDTLIFDFFGSGENEREPVLLSHQIQDLEDVAQWVKEKGYSKINTIGLSFGGLTALLAKIPERKCAIFWAPGFYLNRLFRKKDRLMMKVAKFLHLTPIKRKSSGDYPPILINDKFMQEIDAIDMNKELEQFSTPSLIIHGSADTTLPPEFTREAIRHMPKDENHKRIEVDGANHDFKDHHLEEFIQKSILWLKKYYYY